MDRKRKNEVILIAALLLLAMLSFVLIRVRPGAAGAGAPMAVVSVDGKTVGEYPLSGTFDLVIEGASGGSNRLVIRDGEARVTEADCPDKVCRDMGAIREIGETIVCLPHKVIVTIR